MMILPSANMSDLNKGLLHTDRYAHVHTESNITGPNDFCLQIIFQRIEVRLSYHLSGNKTKGECMKLQKKCLRQSCK